MYPSLFFNSLKEGISDLVPVFPGNLKYILALALFKYVPCQTLTKLRSVFQTSLRRVFNLKQ